MAPSITKILWKANHKRRIVRLESETEEHRMENSFDSLSVLRCLLDKENKTKTSRANFLHHAIEFLVEEQTKDLLQEKTMKFPSHWRKSVLI